MAKVDILYEKGIKLQTPKTYWGRFCQYGKKDEITTRTKFYFMLREEVTGMSLIPPLWDFSPPIYTESGFNNTKMTFKGYEYTGEDNNKERFVQSWTIDFCDEGAFETIKLAEVISTIPKVD